MTISGFRSDDGHLRVHAVMKPVILGAGVVLCGLGLCSKPGLGLGFYGLGPLKSKARAGQEGSGRARAEPGLDPGLGRLATCGHMM